MRVLNSPGLRGLYGAECEPSKLKLLLSRSEDEALRHMGSTELAANLFRATQAEDKLRREQTRGKLRANQLHYDVGKKVRQTIHDLGGTMPENLPTAENIEKVARRLRKAATNELDMGVDTDPQA